jgi:hypothetical protein
LENALDALQCARIDRSDPDVVRACALLDPKESER